MKKYFSTILVFFCALSAAFAANETRFPNGIIGNVQGVLTGHVEGYLNGNATTASAFDHTPAGCSANQYATTISANGNLTCGAITNEATTGSAASVANTLVLRDGSSNFSANQITANLVGNVTGNVSGTAATFTGNLTGDVTSIGMGTTVIAIKGVTVDDTAKADGKALVYKSGSGNIEYSAVSSGGGGGGSAVIWNGDVANSPINGIENDQPVFFFSDGNTEYLTTTLKVPDSYVTGNPVNLKTTWYSLSSSGTVLLKATSYLVRTESESFSSIANSHASTNSAQTNTSAVQTRTATIDVSDGSGQLGGVAITKNSVIRVVLTRDTGTDTDTGDVRFVPNATEVLFQ
jgi:hypothetical protein